MSHFAAWRIEMNGRERFRATIERRTEDEIGEICVICG